MLEIRWRARGRLAICWGHCATFLRGRLCQQWADKTNRAAGKRVRVITQAPASRSAIRGGAGDRKRERVITQAPASRSAIWIRGGGGDRKRERVITQAPASRSAIWIRGGGGDRKRERVITQAPASERSGTLLVRRRAKRAFAKRVRVITPRAPASPTSSRAGGRSRSRSLCRARGHPSCTAEDPCFTATATAPATTTSNNNGNKNSSNSNNNDADRWEA